MDAWTETYVDNDGVKRCSRCNHARPNKGPNQGTNTPSKPLLPGDKAQRIGDMVGNMVKGTINVQRR
jgi:hypothetical protein